MKKGLKECITLLVFVLKLCTCAVNLTHNTLECGQEARLECAVNPLVTIRWGRNGNTLLSCHTNGHCDVGSFGDYTFSINTTSSISTITINPVAYSTYQNVSYSCSDTDQISTVIFDISVPLTEVTMQESQNGYTKEFTATTNCVKTDVVFTWSCVSSEDVTRTVSDNCNVSSFTTSGSTAGCSTGTNCSGPGLETKSHVLLFEEYNGTESQTVKLSIKATDGGTTVTMVSYNTYTIKGSATTIETTNQPRSGHTTTSTTSTTYITTTTTLPATTPTIIATTRSTAVTFTSSSTSHSSQSTAVTINGVGRSQTLPMSSIGSSSTTQAANQAVPTGKHSLNTGEKAGIGISVLIVICVSIIICYYVWITKQGERQTSDNQDGVNLLKDQKKAFVKWWSRKKKPKENDINVSKSTDNPPTPPPTTYGGFSLLTDTEHHENEDKMTKIKKKKKKKKSEKDTSEHDTLDKA